jgi:hypothetical protein
MKRILILITLTIFLTSCALLAKQLLPLKLSRLHIDVETSEFYRTYEKCTGRFFKKCRLERISYDYCGSKQQRKEFKDIGMKLKVTR